jgi:anti-sigma regulatory factor (Ser/Thr protein kinase)
MTEVKIASSPDHLPRLRSIVTCVARSLGMTEQEEQDARLAVTEALANAIRHGSPNGNTNSVIVRLYADDRSMVAEVTDEGGGFDPSQLRTPDIRRPGGMGIPLMRALTDSVEFERNGHGMTVRLRKEAKERSLSA